LQKLVGAMTQEELQKIKGELAQGSAVVSVWQRIQAHS